LTDLDSCVSNLVVSRHPHWQIPEHGDVGRRRTTVVPT
jgi:hypothetical protein